MFQSVAPCPGKVAFQLEPFPVPDLKILSKESIVAELPVAEPVAVAAPEIQKEFVKAESVVAEQEVKVAEPVLEAAIEDEPVAETIESAPKMVVELVEEVLAESEEESQLAMESKPEPILESPVLAVAEEVAEQFEVPDVVEAVEPVVEFPEIAPSTPAENKVAEMVSPFLKAEEVTANESESVTEVKAVIAEALEEAIEAENAHDAAFQDEFFQEAVPVEAAEMSEEVAPELALAEEQVEKSIRDPFVALAPEVVSESSIVSSESERPNNPFGSLQAEGVGVAASKAASTEFYQQPQAAVAGQVPSVTSWQPPAPSDKKKGSRFGGFFRQ